jgi:phospholipid transport system substrate-binding protein
MRENNSITTLSRTPSQIVSWILGLTLWILGLTLMTSVGIFAAVSVAHTATDGGAMTMVRSTVNQVMAILNDHQNPQDVRRRRLIQVVAGHFDFTDMARSSLGYHWGQLKPDQRGQFVPLFTAFMEDAYLDKVAGYSGQKIEFVNETSDGPGFAQVSTKVTEPNGGDPIRLDYRLRHDGGEWKVYDVAVDNISITANYRNQFNRVINSRGFDALMGEMKSKQQELLASLGK